MGLHPTGIDNSDHCVLCFDCVRSCPHHSMQLDLRNPVLGLFNQARHGFYEALFSVTLVGVIIAAKGTPLLAGRSRDVFPHTMWSLSESVLALIIVTTFTGLALLSSTGTRSSLWKPAFTICGIAYLPLAIAGLFMIYFRALVEGGAQIIPRIITAAGLDNWLDAARLTPELGTLRLLVYPILVTGAIFSWFVLSRLQNQYDMGASGRIGHRVLILLAAAAFIRIL